MPKDGRKNITPISKKKQHILSKTQFFQRFFLVPKKKHPPTKKTRFRFRKTSSFATTGWWPRSLEVMDFFRRIPEGGGPFFGWERIEGSEGRELYLPRFWSTHLGWFFFVFCFEVLCFFLVGTSEKKSSWNWKKVLRKNEQLFFCMLSFFGRFFRKIFLFVMFVLCFCGGEKERAAVYQPDTTRKPLGFMGKSTFVCSLAISKVMSPEWLLPWNLDIDLQS